MPTLIQHHLLALVVALAAAGCESGSEADAFCASCSPDEICVQHFDGVCGPPRLECMPRYAACDLADGCSAACDLQCKRGDAQNPIGSCASSCPEQLDGVLACHGP